MPPAEPQPLPPSAEPQPLPPPEEYEFPVSPAQARLLVLDRMHPGSAQYHVPAAFLVDGPFDLPAFGRALDALVARHESLRTSLRAEGGEYRQVVAERARVEIGIGQVDSVEEARPVLLAEAARPFDLADGPLLRCTVYTVAGGGHLVLLTVHHAVCDGWSLQLMLAELGALHRGEELEPLPLQYPDYAAWQRERQEGGGFDASVGHWRELLAGAPATLELPTDRPRPAVQSAGGGAERFVLTAAVRARLAELARRRGTTPFTVLFAAYHAFLARISGRRDLVVGFPVSGRDLPELQGMVGMLTNTLALRTELDERRSFHHLVDALRDRLDASRPYQDAPFGAVVDAVAPERQLSHDPVVQVMFAYDDDTELRLDLPWVRTERLELLLPDAKFDLMLYVERLGEDLVARFFHRTDLFDRGTVRAWARSFQELLDGLLDRPDRPLAEVGLLPAEDRHRILRGWNATATATTDRTVHDLVAERAAERPGALALVAEETILTYRQLLDRADALAARLRAAGVGVGVPVGLCLPRTAEVAVAALAVLRAGGAYLPLDPEQPPARLAHMLTEAGAALVLATPATAGRVAGPGVRVGVLGEGDGPELAPAVRPVGEPGPGDLAYVLYTSGSTGTPKGVAVEHRALTNLAVGVRPQFPVTAADRVLQYVSFGFDVAVSDLFFAWVAGAELHLAGEDERLGEPLFARLRDSRASYAFLPPSAAMSLPCPPGALPELRTLAIGGEACPPELVARWAVGGRRLVDAYGPSENTVYSTTAVLRPGEPVVIGRPVANTRAYVLDPRLRPVPVGVVGEIYLAGTGLARGYQSRPGLTAERFVADPYGPPGSRMYRTGDLGRFDAEGTLSYLGRVDGQVKVRGFRVELGEIETVLAAHPEVSRAAATVFGTGTDRRLAGYAVPADPAAAPALAGLRGWLADRLPGYMVPETIQLLPELPLNRSGKVDRGRLPEPSGARPELDRPYTAPRSATELALAGLWSAVLGVERIGVHDNFFELGGNSIRLLAVQTALRERGHPGLGLVELFRHPDIATLARRLDGAGADGAEQARSAAAGHGRARRERLAAARTRTGTRTTSDHPKGHQG
ncbi:amino acid adenylation domain-containing protein [Kitasatospora sp. NPDC051853]|uniref:amino acid adenylation domain-containing protein n=1 Tax=Kitasatospora sp. NPDC051853 TaxID=3364058 RepID=UPI00378FC728